ncbi:hypothetical protein ACFXKY_08045 [Streptomyces canus]|uniref:hypothetical protein n=1 Tax=Streptomyces canus TaxID=58343 RepID=UPI003698ACAA
MAQYGWGDVTLGRIPLRETFAVSESGGSDGRGLDLEGQESYPPLTRAQVVARHDGINALVPGQCIAVTFTDKPERSGYYAVKSASSTYTEYLNDMVTADWKVSLDRVGSDSETDLQSRLTGAVRLNDFSLTGERWHAPPIGHYGYTSGTTNPTTMTRTGADGTITVYRGVPANISPRWGCPPTSYLNGRVRCTTTGGQEVYGSDVPLAATGWSLTNGLVNITWVTTGGGSFDVQAYTGSAYRSKLWTPFTSSGGQIGNTWDGATLLRNDPEMAILRLVKALSPGRFTLDLTLRRGSRFVEGYMQRNTAADQLKIRLNTAEAFVDTSAQGYLTATSDDADGNRFAAGSARTFTAHANGGIQKNTTTSLDFWIGASSTGAGGITLNTNPDFDTNLTGWTGNGGTAVRVTTPVKLGAGAAQFTPNGVAQFPSLNSAAIAVTAGTLYRATAWIRCATARAVDLNINWFDNASAYLSTGTITNTLVANTFTFYDGTVTAPANAVTATLSPTVPNFPPATDVIVVDEARLRLPVASGDAATDLRNQYIAAMPEAVYGVRR